VSDDEQAGSRPTPVREVMNGGEEEPQRGEEEKRFTAGPEEVEWIAQVVGRAGSGILPSRLISLLEISFARTDAPEEPLWRALCQGESLEAMSEEELRDLLREARPVEEEAVREEDAPPRGRRKRGRRSSRG